MINKNQVYQGEGIFLIPFEEDYIQEYLNFFQQNSELYQMTSTVDEITKESLQETILFYKNDPNNFCFLIQDQNTQNIIGDVNFNHYGNMENDEIEFSLMIGHKKDRRKGYGKRVLNLIEQILLENKFRKILVKIPEENTPSINFFLKNNFTNHKKNEQFKEIELLKILQLIEQKLLIYK